MLVLDTPVRRAIAPGLDAIAARLDRPGVTPDRLTIAGLAAGLVSAGLAALALWIPALALWLASRLLDGLDGPLARRRAGAGATADAHDSDAGGFLDITCDFVTYAAGVVGVAVGVQVADGGVSAGAPALWPFVAVLAAYYLNGAAFLAFSSIASAVELRTGRRPDLDEASGGRSLFFLGGLAEGTETVLVHSLWLLIPVIAPAVAWVWAAIVGISALQRIVGGYRLLRRPLSGP